MTPVRYPAPWASTLALLGARCGRHTRSCPAFASPSGYYRFPALANDTLIFAAGGDRWTVAIGGGKASRLPSHPGEERNPVISPDGETVAFVGSYEGPPEVFTMPIGGGLPVRRTFNGGRSVPVAWMPQTSQLVIATQRYSTLPNTQLVQVDLTTGAMTLLPLAQASDASFDTTGNLFFTRQDFQGGHTRRYVGGTAQNLWRIKTGGGEPEATPLTGDYDGTSASPMFFDGRLFFRSDRSGGMNIWSMSPDGKDPKQISTHTDYEVKSPSLGTIGAARGKIAYQLGADLWMLDLATGKVGPVPITLESDLDQMREKWVDKPMEMVTSAHLSPDGERVALTARGRVFVAPRKTGRLVEATRQDGVRHRDGRFIAGEGGESKSILTLSDKSGEVELWTGPADGVGDATQLTTDADVLRWEAVPAPDGKHIAHHDKNQRLWIYDAAAKTSKKIDENPIDNFGDLRWSPDGRWLAYVAWTGNLNTQIKLYDTQSGAITLLTSDRTQSSSPAWAPAGEFLYFLSDRNLQSVVGSPWGAMQPEPFFDKRTKVYAIALKPGLRSPFDEPDELHPAKKAKDEDKAKGSDSPSQREGAGGRANAPADEPPGKDKSTDEKPAPPKPIEIDLAGIADRIYATPVPPGNYAGLYVNDKAFFFASADARSG